MFRYFVIKVVEGGKTAHLGLGFADRSDSFDLNTTLHDHFRSLQIDPLKYYIFPGHLITISD